MRSKLNPQIIPRLIDLKLRIDATKMLYAQYDELLQALLNSGEIPRQIAYDGDVWDIRLIDCFALKNTAWKSVAQRRYDLSIVRLGARSQNKKPKKR